MTTEDDVGRYNGKAIGNLSYAPGRHALAFLFNGKDAAVTVADNDALWPAGSFSLQGWVKTSTSGTLLQKIECGGACPMGSSVSSAFWSLGISSEGFPSFQVRANQTSKSFAITDPQHVITDGTWHHMVGVRDVLEKQLLLYVDGSLAVSMPLASAGLGPLSNTDGETDPVVIGAQAIPNASGYDHFFAGTLEELAFSGSAITAAEVQAIYAAADGECQ